MAYCYLIKKHTIVSFHDLSHVSQGSFSQPSSPWLAQAALIDKSWREKFFKIMAGRLLHITMRNFFPKVEYFAIWHRHLLHSANKQRRSGHATYVHMNWSGFVQKKCIEFMVVQCIDRSYNYVYSLQFHVIFWLIWNVP